MEIAVGGQTNRLGQCGGIQLVDEKLLLASVIGNSVANVFGVQLSQLKGGSRGRAKIAFGRQVAMYLTHVHLGLTLTCTGILFGRDRTTVAHACEQIENLRDDPGFDLALGLLERAFYSVEAFVNDAGAKTPFVGEGAQ